MNDCLGNISYCDKGLTISAWVRSLFIHKRSTVYYGEKSIALLVRKTDNDELYYVSILIYSEGFYDLYRSIKHVTDVSVWNYYTVSYNENDNCYLMINDQMYDLEVFRSWSHTTEQGSYFIIGDKDRTKFAIFEIDELKIWFSSLNMNHKIDNYKSYFLP